MWKMKSFQNHYLAEIFVFWGSFGFKCLKILGLGSEFMSENSGLIQEHKRLFFKNILIAEIFRFWVHVNSRL
uniref:Uncharacterized protein n=1 Tax=Nelumbo nucifera TaxID=4432 RepID=A0A822ZR34_NELNU|nr:TPA_asm: hypothetical protein HUJ06_004202 [Nelumbo nucifera]